MTFQDMVGRIPDSLEELALAVTRDLGGHPAAGLVRGCLTNTWATSMRPVGDGEVFVITGDIPAMWLRDSTAQVRPYLAVAGQDPSVADALAGVSRRQVRYVLTDPYANAFNEGPDGGRAYPFDVPPPGPWVWERKYEVDSLAAVLQLAYALWRATGRTDHLDDRFTEAAWAIVRLWRLEQRHDGSPYAFERNEGPWAGDSLSGTPVGWTGMTWSGFRPSDDPCSYGYLVPSNALASVSLRGLAEMTADAELALESLALADEIDAGIRAHAVVDGVLAYEVDGLGGALLADDANLPSLLSLPFTGWCTYDDPLYLATRELVLSPANPWYFSGKAAAGIGSPHTEPGYVWPLALAARGLTAPGEAEEMLAVLARTTGGTGLMHESFDADDPSRFTREWFGWANAMFAELAMTLTGPPSPRCSAEVDEAAVLAGGGGRADAAGDADQDPGAVGAEQVVGVLERPAGGVQRRPGDGQGGRALRHLQDRRFLGAAGHRLDALDGLRGTRAVPRVEQLVERAAERQVEQAGEERRGQARPLERQRRAVREPDADDLGDQVARLEPERGGGDLGRGHQRGADHPRPGGETLLAQQRGHADHGGQVALDHRVADERAAASALHPPHRPGLLQQRERLSESGTADAQAQGQLPFPADPVTRLQGPGGDHGQQVAAGRGDVAHYI
nr:glycoside hydrolase family 125 protein [Nonomuraea sediminis]